jgi:hypothetical protein
MQSLLKNRSIKLNNSLSVIIPAEDGMSSGLKAQGREHRAYSAGLKDEALNEVY